MANQEKQPSGTDNNKRDNGDTIDGNDNPPNDDRNNPPQSQSKTDTEKHNQQSQPEDPPEPTIFEADVPYDERITATALAATSLARFDPNERNVQLSEHYQYIDHDYKRKGYL